MAQITLTTALPTSQVVSMQACQFGETVAAGRWVYRNTTDRLYYLASSAVDAETANAVGLVAVGGGVNDWGIMFTSGIIEVDNLLSQGENYLLASEFDTAHTKQIELYSDVQSGEYETYLGFAVASNQLQIALNATGSTKP